MGYFYYSKVIKNKVNNFLKGILEKNKYQKWIITNKGTLSIFDFCFTDKAKKNQNRELNEAILNLSAWKQKRFQS